MKKLKKKRKKKKGKRCNFCDNNSSCKVKLKLTDYPCRCGLFFCGKHKHNHNCTFDYRGDYKDKLLGSNPDANFKK